MLLAEGWQDYELIDSGGGEKLERWGRFILRRPDPQAIWPVFGKAKQWDKYDAMYHRSSEGGGRWEIRTSLPDKWKISYRELSFYVEPMGFKHTGIFPEQSVNWDYIIKRISAQDRKIRVLNLFAYTGGATIASAYAGAEVCHVDAAKGMVQRAKENAVLSGLQQKPVRYIVDDVQKFVQREINRNRDYDAIIMDPPSYGRGPKGELWKLEEEIFSLIELCIRALSSKPLFFIINSYTTGLSPIVIKNMLDITLSKRFGGKVLADEMGIAASSTGLMLPCGATSRWEAAY